MSAIARRASPADQGSRMEMDRPKRKLPALARAKARRPLRVRASPALLPLLCLLGCWPAIGATPASAAGTGGVAGLVEAAKSQAPLAGVEVCARPVAEPLAPPVCATTDAKGEYLIAELAEGQYVVSFKPPAESGYRTQFFNGREAEAQADPVAVTEGATTPNVSAALVASGEIKGAVTEGEDTPAAGVEVCAFAKGAEAPVQCAKTEATGAYAIAGLEAGEYEVEFLAPAGYATQFYEAAESRVQAKPVSVTAGAPVVEGVSAVLRPAPGAIAGTVSSAMTGLPLANAKVCASRLPSSPSICRPTEASGAYTLPSLEPGDYRVEFIAPEGEAYATRYFDEKPYEAEAEAVTVKAGATTGAIDVRLGFVPLSQANPSIVGQAVQGQTLSFTRGSWLYEPTLVTDEWGRCGSSGAIKTCHTIATTPTYTLTGEDVGGTIRIREKAFDAFGEGVAFSRATAVVAAPVASAPGNGGPAPAPVANGAVSSSVAWGASAAQLKALLTKLLVPRGRGAKIATLRARGSYSTTFASLAAGRISIAWYFVPKGAHLSAAGAKPKPQLVASGKLTTREAGTAKLTIGLTAAGRALLRKGKSLKLTAKGAFAPKGRPTLNAARSFTLSR